MVVLNSRDWEMCGFHKNGVGVKAGWGQGEGWGNWGKRGIGTATQGVKVGQGRADIVINSNMYNRQFEPPGDRLIYVVQINFLIC